jgi:glycine cleavage system aminomethyltransferase T
LRIEAGYVLFDREVDGRANPRELGLERLLSTPRHFLLRRRLVGLEILDRPTQPDLPAAQVTSECLSPSLGRRIALGFAAAGTMGEVRLADGRLARVAALPFYAGTTSGNRPPRKAPC